jgi:hypothetical protein
MISLINNTNRRKKNGQLLRKNMSININLSFNDDTIIESILKKIQFFHFIDELQISIDRDKKTITINNKNNEIDKTQILLEQKLIFISHSSKEKELLAIPLYNCFKKLNLDPWLDNKNMQGSDSLSEKISDAIHKSSSYVLIISPAFIKGKWTNKELDAIFIQHIDKQKKIFIILYKVSIDEFKSKYALLAGLIVWETNGEIEKISNEISSIVESEKNIDI